DGQAVEEMDRMPVGSQDRMICLPRLQVAFSQRAEADAPAALRGWLDRDAEEIGQAARSADAEPGSPGAHPVLQTLCQFGRESRFPDGEQQAQIEKPVEKFRLGNRDIAEARMIQYLPHVGRMLYGAGHIPCGRRPDTDAKRRVKHGCLHDDLEASELFSHSSDAFAGEVGALLTAPSK